MARGKKQGPSVPLQRTPAVYRSRAAGRGTDPATQWMWSGLGVFIAVLVGVAVWATRTHPTPAPPQRPNTAPVDGIACDSGANAGYTANVHLDILIAGKAMAIPAGTGVFSIAAQQQCRYWLHTTDATGIVQIAAPKQQAFTVGQFFDIWGLPLSQTNLAGHQAGTIAGQATGVRAYVNGQAYTGSPRDIPLTAHAQITLEYGPPWVPAKAAYVFPKGD